MNMTLVVTHRIELPPLLEQFLTVMLGQLTGAVARDLSFAEDNAARQRLQDVRDAERQAQARAAEDAARAAAIANELPQPAEAKPAEPVKKRGRPSNAEKAAAANAQSVPSVAPVAQTVVPPVAAPTVAAAPPAPAAPANDPWNVGTATPAETKPAASLLNGQPPATQEPLATQATWADVEAAFNEVLFSNGGEMKLQKICSKYAIATFDQLKPEQFTAVVTDLKGALRS